MASEKMATIRFKNTESVSNFLNNFIDNVETGSVSRIDSALFNQYLAGKKLNEANRKLKEIDKTASGTIYFDGKTYTKEKLENKISSLENDYDVATEKLMSKQPALKEAVDQFLNDEISEEEFDAKLLEASNELGKLTSKDQKDLVNKKLQNTISNLEEQIIRLENSKEELLAKSKQKTTKRK